MSKDSKIELAGVNSEILINKAGLYRFDMASGSLRVYGGQLSVRNHGGKYLKIKKGKEVNFSTTVLSANKFQTKLEDDFSLWSRQRTRYVAMANMNMAKMLYDYYPRNNFAFDIWFWNPYMGMFTFMPYRGMNSFYGYRFWSPIGFYNYQNNRDYSNQNYSRTAGNQVQSGQVANTSPTIRSMESQSSSPRPSTVQRDSGHAGGLKR